jgi:hypothetical protein
MNKTSFSNTLYSFPKIMSKENSTFYKTFYSNSSPKTSKVSLKLKSSSPSSQPPFFQNQNIPLSSYAKYTSHLKNNLINKKNRKYTSLVKRKNSFSSAETDDTFFANSEVKNIDKKIIKRINKCSIWKEKLNNIYGMYASSNKKDIQNIRRNIREFELGTKDFDLKAEINRKKYFPMEKVEIIFDATDIMNKMKKSLNNEKKSYQTFFRKNQADLNTFIIQNREICKKNFLIGLITNEREKIKIKEKEIQKDLEDAKKIFVKDEAEFNQFTQEKKVQFRKAELNLDINNRNNKILMEKIRKCSMEVHETESEIVRNIKGIILYKNYADFIHKLLGKNKIVADLRGVKNSLQSKDKDLTSIARHVIKLFNFLLNSKDIPVKTEEINNPDLLTALFFSLEGNIIHQLKERDEILKEKFNDKILFEKEIAILKEKVESDQKKLDMLTKELNISKNIYITDDYQERIDDASKLIYEISEELINTQISQNKNKSPIDNVIDTNLAILKKTEDTINQLFEEIESIKNSDKGAEELFKTIVDEIKLKNKIQKYKEGREAMMISEEEKNLKYLQKNYRYRVRGPIRYPPPYILERKKEKNDKEQKSQINEEEMIYYDEK